MGVLICCLYYVLNIKSQVHTQEVLLIWMFPVMFFGTSLSLRRQLLWASRVSSTICWLVLRVNTKSLVMPRFPISGSSSFNALDKISPKLPPNVRLIYLQKSPGLQECTCRVFAVLSPNSQEVHLKAVTQYSSLSSWLMSWVVQRVYLTGVSRENRTILRWPPGASPDRGLLVMTGSFLSISTDAWACQKHKALGKRTFRIFQLCFLK